MNSNFYSNLKKSIVAAAIFVMTTSTLFATVPSAGTGNSITEAGAVGIMYGTNLVNAQIITLDALAGDLPREEAFKAARFIASEFPGTWIETELNKAVRRGDLLAVLKVFLSVESGLSKILEGERGWGFRTGLAVERARIGSEVHQVKFARSGLDKMPALVQEGAKYASSEELRYLETIAKYAGRDELTEAEFGEINYHAAGFQKLFLIAE